MCRNFVRTISDHWLGHVEPGTCSNVESDSRFGKGKDHIDYENYYLSAWYVLIGVIIGEQVHPHACLGIWLSTSTVLVFPCSD